MERPHIYLGVYATAADGGSALGPLLAYSAGALVSLASLYVMAGAALTAAVFRFCWLERKESV
jgi:hypothetical protein